MSDVIEEPVKLPAALAGQLGSMTVRYQGWEQCDRRDEESSKLLCAVVWKKRYYGCPLMLPLQGISFDETLADDCRSLLREVVEHDEEFAWRSQYLAKIGGLVERAARRLFKRLSKEKRLPQALRHKRARAR